MALQYKGINIPEEIIIVEKQIDNDEKTPQGFVVPKGKNNILETAMRWARWTKHYDHYDAELRKWVVDAPPEEKLGIQHLYKNGTFKIKLYDSAGYSSQGGKLSFWNCTIVAEDGREFIIGINQDLLLNILLNSTVINGEVQGNVWLGREKNNTGVYTPDMEDFKQAQKDEEVRNTKLSSNYQPGQVVTSKTEGDSVYLGVIWRYFDFEYHHNWGGGYIDITIYNKPKKGYVYYDEENNYRPYQILNSKAKKIITDKIRDKSIEKEWVNIYNKQHDHDNDSYYEEIGPLFDLQYSLKLENKPTWVLKETLEDFCKKYYSQVNKDSIYINFVD